MLREACDVWACMALLRNLTSLAPRSLAAPLLVTPTHVDQLRRQKKISFLDASWFMPNSPRNPSQEFISKRIPGAHFLDLDQVASQHPLGLKHMMPNEQAFAKACGMCARLQPSSTDLHPGILGIEPSSHVVMCAIFWEILCQSFTIYLSSVTTRPEYFPLLERFSCSDHSDTVIPVCSMVGFLPGWLRVYPWKVGLPTLSPRHITPSQD